MVELVESWEDLPRTGWLNTWWLSAALARLRSLIYVWHIIYKIFVWFYRFPTDPKLWSYLRGKIQKGRKNCDILPFSLGLNILQISARSYCRILKQMLDRTSFHFVLNLEPFMQKSIEFQSVHKTLCITETLLNVVLRFFQQYLNAEEIDCFLNGNSCTLHRSCFLYHCNLHLCNSRQ